jgi:hypothetical protein
MDAEIRNPKEVPRPTFEANQVCNRQTKRHQTAIWLHRNRSRGRSAHSDFEFRASDFVVTSRFI